LVSLYLDALDPEIVSGQGSDLGRALRVAVATVVEQRRPGVVVLLSDGEGFGEREELEGALAYARKAGVRVHTVLVGSVAGAPVPGVGGSPRSMADPIALRGIAEQTGGLAIQADGPSVGRLADLLRSQGDGDPGRTPAPAAPVSWFAWGALLALVAEGALARGAT
jgi:hypothetical protein